MFLDVLLRRNRAFVDTAVELHRTGALPANTYVLDLEAVRHNACALRDEADRLGLRLFAMSKQVGRNPAFLAALRHAGVDSCVAVDMADARVVHREGMRLGHIGHLVQVPRAEAGTAVAMRPEYWTVFSIEQARLAAGAARQLAHEQALLARIHAPGDHFYSGHEGGFPASEIRQVAEMLDGLDGARFAGVTTFPALLYDPVTNSISPTPNLSTLTRAAEDLGGGVHINAPGTTSTAVLESLASHGATQVEPGHALTGTTPLHAREDLVELPAVLYLTEVSHRHGAAAYCFGGGMYIDPVFPSYQVRALVNDRLIDAELAPPEAIDYYGRLLPGDDPMPAIGDSVVFGFRIQAFVTRAYVAAVDGVRIGHPRLAGIWSAAGEPASWPA
jgi:predicted amino acid racemase